MRTAVGTLALAAAATVLPVLLLACGSAADTAAEVAADVAADTATDTPSAPSTERADVWEANATVERVVDGDTIIAGIGDRSESVRLIGIDTPESVARERPVECYSKEATQHLQELLPRGTPIALLRDVEARDIYDRLLGYVVRSSDGLFVNLEMVTRGYAAALNFPPNDYYADAFARAESEAMAAGRGLWNECGGPDVPLE